MKDQKERYRQAKEELKRVQEDFRSLRDRLKVMKSSYVLLRSTDLQRFLQSSLTLIGFYSMLHFRGLFAHTYRT